MKELVDKLLADLRWRFQPAGRSYKPTSKEIQSWGTLSIPWSVPLLLWPVAGALWFGVFELAGLQSDLKNFVTRMETRLRTLKGSPK